MKEATGAAADFLIHLFVFVVMSLGEVHQLETIVHRHSSETQRRARKVECSCCCWAQRSRQALLLLCFVESLSSLLVEGILFAEQPADDEPVVVVVVVAVVAAVRETVTMRSLWEVCRRRPSLSQLPQVRWMFGTSISSVCFR